MGAADEFSHLAARCRVWAEEAETERVRKVFLELAEFWEAASARARAENDPPTSVRQNPAVA